MKWHLHTNQRVEFIDTNGGFLAMDTMFFIGRNLQSFAKAATGVALTMEQLDKELQRVLGNAKYEI